jgi:hypothetical protein
MYTLKTADGGVLAVFPSAYTIEYPHKQFLSGGSIVPGKTEAVYNSKSRPVITDEYQGQALVKLTPEGKPQVLAREFRMTDSN